MHGEAHWAVILIPATLLSVANECEVLHAKSYSLLSCSATEDWVNKPFWQVFIASRLIILPCQHADTKKRVDGHQNIRMIGRALQRLSWLQPIGSFRLRLPLGAGESNSTIVSSLQSFGDLCEENGEIPEFRAALRRTSIFEDVVRAIKARRSRDVVLLGWLSVGHLASQCPEDVPRLINEGVCSAAATTLSAYADDSYVTTFACLGISHIAAFDSGAVAAQKHRDVAAKFGDAGTCVHLVKILKSYIASNELDVAEEAAFAIGALACTDSNYKAFVEADVLNAVIEALRKAPSHRGLCEAVTTIAHNFAVEKTYASMFVNAGVCWPLINAAQVHGDDFIITIKLLGFFANASAGLDSEVLVNNMCENGACGIIARALDLFSDEDELVKHACVCIVNFAGDSADARDQFIALGVPDKLQNLNIDSPFVIDAIAILQRWGPLLMHASIRRLNEL